MLVDFSIIIVMDKQSIKQKIKKTIWFIHNTLNNNGLRGGVIIGLSHLTDCRFEVHGMNSSVVIGDGCIIRGLHVLVYGDNTQVVLKDNVHINASKSHPVVMNAFDGANIYIGDGCLFSNSIELHTTDYHSIVDLNGKRINPSEPITIGSHVWIGLRTIILKGSNIASNNIVGACSLVNKSFDNENTIIVGNPATIKKNDVNWDIRNLPI